MLSLAFVLAFIGAAVGLLVGILIFGEVSDAIQCPVSTGGGGGNGTAATNLGNLGSSADGQYFEENIQVNFNPSQVGIINQAAYQEGISSLENQGEIRFGTPVQWDFLHDGATGSNLVSVNIWVKGDFVGGPSYPIIDTFHCTFYDVRCVAYGGVVDNQPDNGMLWFAQSGFIRYKTNNANSENFATPFIAAPANNGLWHMLTVVYDKSDRSGSICKDGVCTGFGPSTPMTTGGGVSVSTMTIGSTHGCCGGTVEKSQLVDDFTIWSGYMLTPTDISNLWNGGSGMSAGGISPSTQKLHITFDTFAAPAPGEPALGEEQCNQAKDTAWTVIGIMPVALFFGLFALFGSFQRPT